MYTRYALRPCSSLSCSLPVFCTLLCLLVLRLLVRPHIRCGDHRRNLPFRGALGVVRNRLGERKTGRRGLVGGLWRGRFFGFGRRPPDRCRLLLSYPGLVTQQLSALKDIPPCLDVSSLDGKCHSLYFENHCLERRFYRSEAVSP